MRDDDDYGKRQPLLDDYDGKRAARGRYQSNLPRSPFKLASDYAKQDTGLSQYMSPTMHQLMYIAHVFWFVVCVPTLVFHLLISPGHVDHEVYQWIWCWLAFSFSWQGIEGVLTMLHHITTTCFHRPSRNDFSKMTYPKATAVIVAYLPNEADIIMETLAHFRDLGYEGELEVILAYNTPKILSVEQDIAALQKTWPEFTAHKVVGSTSKCDNLNAILPLIKGQFVGIFDSDHLPLPRSFELAWRDLCNGSDVVQGRTKINPKYVEDTLSAIIAGEFEVRHGIEHGSRKAVYNYAVFGGSNGFWRTDVLQFIGMDPGMLTEDIDSSIRAMSYGYKITYNHHLVSLEQPPPNFGALWKQRLRWSQGWYQVSWRSFMTIFGSNFLEPRQKIGFHWMVKMAMPCQIAYSHMQSFLLVCLTAKLGMAAVLALTSVWMVPQLIFLYCFAELRFSWKVLYTFCMLPLMGFFIFVDLIAQVRLMIGYSTWHVTTRKKVDKQPGEADVPHSPNTFRYSPSSVHLDRTIRMAEA